MSPRAVLSSVCRQGDGTAWYGVAERSPWAALKPVPWNRICSICTHWHRSDLTQSLFFLLLLHNEIDCMLLFGRATQQRSLLLLEPRQSGGTAAVTTAGHLPERVLPDLSCAGSHTQLELQQGTQGELRLLPSSTQPSLFTPG